MRLIRPMNLARICTLVLGVGVAVPAPVQGAPAAQAQKSTATTRKTTAKKTTYSASASSARKARLARARAAARTREQTRVRALQTAMTPRFKLDATGALVPDIRAAASIILDPSTGAVLWQENAQEKRSIASITKVMTAVVFLEDQPDLSQMVTVERGDTYAASTTYLRANERITLDNLLHLTLIASDNAAARALARLSHGGTATFVERMNSKAVELGLESTSFTDPSGLKPENVSSAYDLSRLITYASSDERIAPIMRTAEYKVETNRRTISIHNTNRLVIDGDVTVMAGKTGFISKAGHCLVTLLRMPAGNHGRVCRAWRQLQPRAFLGDPPPLQLVVAEDDRPAAERSAPGLIGSRYRLAVPLLNRRRVERQRRHPIHDGHDRPRGTTGVVRLDIAFADVARIQPVLAVPAGKRRDARTIGVEAEGAGERLEVPARRAAAANKEPVGRRGDDREVRLTAAERAASAVPAGQVASRHHRIPGAGHERAHRLLKDRFESLELRAHGSGARPHRLVPRPDDAREAFRLEGELFRAPVVRSLERVVVAHGRGRRPQQEAQVTPIDGQVLELQDRA